MRIIILLVALFFSLPCLAVEQVYSIESADHDENFIINEMQYAAKAACPGFLFGDQVVFLTGNPDGSCTESTILNLANNATCEVWCQYPL